ncbi:oligoendopeptidase F [Natroniella sulfidigena]|uniref:oligoendopeptidase F n=1 Tax=Natroniella sulfidigena TaxID=723921 RepID=UPI00200B21C6|nr:oligoendopeptidase F [Natroniella sulfidigena]MCK8817631.1 oligoendopeptidase F [Natroniella sulfidigena]
MDKQGLPTRDEIAEEFKWDLTAIYESDQKWEEEFNQVASRISEIEAFQGQLTESADKLLAGLELSTELNRSLGKLYTYANRKSDEDTANSEYQALLAKVQGLQNQLSSATSFMVPEILQLPTEKLESFMEQEEGLQLYQQNLDDIMRRKEHFLSPEEERIIALAGEVAQGPENIFGMLNNADLDFPTIEDENGEPVQVTHGRFIELLKRDDREVRKSAFEAYYNLYQGQENTLAETLSTNIKKDLFYMRARNYSSSLEASLDGDNIPVKVYDNLLQTVEDNLEYLHDYMELRKRTLPIDELHMYDLYTPLVKDVEMKVEYEEAKEIILNAFEPLGADYLEVVEESFEENWIDVYENKGKRSGAYSASAYDAHPYILLNYTDQIDDLFTLAHELGHALHSYYSNQNQPYIYANYSIFVAEVASTVNEALLMNYLLETTEDEEKRKYILNHYLEQFRGTVYRQTMFADFERLIHQQAEEGQALTSDLLSELYYELNQKYYGEQIVVDDQIAIEWARIPHFYYNFYVYQYATGFSAAVALSQQILEQGEEAVNRYLEFLQGGSSDYPLNLLRQAGVDMESSEPIEKSLAVFSELIEEMEQLI